MSRYAIISDCDAPQPNMVCQLVIGRGYCYLDRTKAHFDGMDGKEATPMEAFGFDITELDDGCVTFIKVRAETAKYRDGKLRTWQSRIVRFGHRMIETAEGRNEFDTWILPLSMDKYPSHSERSAWLHISQSLIHNVQGLAENGRTETLISLCDHYWKRWRHL